MDGPGSDRGSEGVSPRGNSVRCGEYLVMMRGYGSRREL